MCVCLWSNWLVCLVVAPLDTLTMEEFSCQCVWLAHSLPKDLCCAGESPPFCCLQLVFLSQVRVCVLRFGTCQLNQIRALNYKSYLNEYQACI